MKPEISVIVCTHNPRLDYFERVLNALKSQTLNQEKWELLVVDNASDRPLKTEIDVSWHPHSRVVREEKLGLTLARLCGIQESNGETIVFVDDDNVLDSDYLEQTLHISKEWKFIGAWGGQTRPEFEEVPPAWTKSYWSSLAIREFDEDKWANLPEQAESRPCGAGLCIRRCVAEKYFELVKANPKRTKLGRTGKALTGGEDFDIAYTACSIELGTGRFTRLKLTHLIPNKRLQESYLLELIKGNAYSNTILSALWQKKAENLCLSQRIFQHYIRWRMDARSRRFYDASQTGKRMAIKEISTWS